MRNVLVGAATLLVTVLLMLGVVEIVLRLSPSLIGVPILERLHPGIRGEIAGRLGLTTEADRLVLRSAERSDGGPDLFLHLPNRRYVTGVDEADIEAGGIPDMTTDSYGFCNPPGIVEKRPVHVLTIGGSIPNCAIISAEDNFTNRLGEVAGLNSYNLAVPGVGPYEYLETMRRFGLKLAPQVVIMAISEGNDLRDIERFHSFKAGEGRRRAKTPMGGPFAVSYALAVLKGGIEVAVRTFKSDSGPDFRYSAMVQGQRVPLNVRNGDRDELRYARMVSEGRLSPALYEESVADFVVLARDNGFVPLVVMVPAAYTVYAETIVYDDPAITQIMRQYSDVQRKWFADNVERLGGRYFDATGYMQEAARTRPLLYFPSNVHLTPEGHRVLAEAVAPQVKVLLP